MYFQLAGGGHITPILIFVDVVIGPLLTLLVFKSGKPSLKFDLGIIIAIQIAALAYGMHIIFDSRPVFLVARADMLVLVSSNQIDEVDLQLAPERYRKRSLVGPIQVGLQLPSRGTKERAALTDAAVEGRDVEVFPLHYVAIEDMLPELFTRARPVSELRSRANYLNSGVEQRLTKAGLADSEVSYVPIRGKMGDWSMLINAATMEFLGIAPVSPWTR